MTVARQPSSSAAEFGELDAHLFREGKHPRLYETLGSHPVAGGTKFATWAPHAAAMYLVGRQFERESPTSSE